MDYRSLLRADARRLGLAAFSTLLLPVFVAACGGPEAEAPTDSPLADPSAMDSFDDIPAATDELPFGDPDAPNPLTPVEPKIFANVTVFPPHEAFEFGIDEGKLEIPLAGRESLASIEPGHVLISQYLFMRKAVAVERRGNLLVVHTEEAKLTDAVEQGDFDLRPVAFIDPDTGSRVFFDDRDDPFSDAYDPRRVTRVEPEPAFDENDPFGSAHQGVEIEQDAEGITGSVPISNITLGEGRFWKLEYSGKLSVKPQLDMGFTPTMQVTGSVRCCNYLVFPYLERFKVYGEGTFTLTLGVEFKSTSTVSGELKYPLVSNPLDVASLSPTAARPRFVVPCITLAGAIGIVPIWADICAQADLGIKATAYGEVQFNASANFSKTVGGGLEYRRLTGWTRLSKNPPLEVTTNVGGTVNAGVTASAGIETKLKVNLYSAAGPFVAVDSGLKFARKCEPPLLKQDIKWETELAAGVAVDPPQMVKDLLPDVEKLKYQAKLWSGAVKIWEGNGQCSPASVILSYQRVLARPNDPNFRRYADLNMALDVPAAEGHAAGTVSDDSGLATIAQAENGFPSAWFPFADCPGCAETASLTRVYPNATYKIWVYDYENAATGANDTMSRARATVAIVNGARRWSYTAPGGTYNRWDVATFRADANAALTPTALNSTRTVNEY